jgi:cobalt-zinc-cadmium efflux system membrane fusion protein
MKTKIGFHLSCALIVSLLLAACGGMHDQDEDDRAGEQRAEHGQAGLPDQTKIAAAIAQEAGIRVVKAESGVIHDELDAQGLLAPVGGRDARIVARFPGPVRSVRVSVGDTVRTGQPLLTVESNVSLTTYPVTAPFSGTVLALNVAPGDLAGDAPLMEIADMSRLWLDLHLFGIDAAHVAPGQSAEVIRLSDGASVKSTVDRLLPGTESASQSTIARVTIDNTDGQWRPGAVARARITVAEHSVALAVPIAAVQKLKDRDVVFVRNGDVYEARPVVLGRRDAKSVEIRSGVKASEEVVVIQSYLIKAELEKASLEEDKD